MVGGGPTRRRKIQTFQTRPVGSRPVVELAAVECLRLSALFSPTPTGRGIGKEFSFGDCLTGVSLPFPSQVTLLYYFAQA